MPSGAPRSRSRTWAAGRLGCRNPHGNHKCSKPACFSEDEFTPAGTDYTITVMWVQANGTLRLDLGETIAAGSESPIRHVGNGSFAFTEADTIGGARREWNNFWLS